MTREEVRVVTLAKLRLRHDICVCGISVLVPALSVSRQTTLLPQGAGVKAIERNEESLRFLIARICVVLMPAMLLWVTG